MEPVSDSGRRLAALLLVLGVIGTPAVALRAACIGGGCDDDAPTARPVPFCSLPAALRELLTAGFREGRSPEALGVTPADTVLRNEDGAGAPWPSLADAEAPPTVPLVFAGPAIAPSDAHRAGLDDVAPTVQGLLGIRRPFPAVRSGEPIAGIIRPDGRSPLVVTIVWKRGGTADRPAIARSVGGAPGGTSTVDAEVGSLPLDPAAVLTTLGTGGLPMEHGIIGAMLRDDRGNPVPAWSDRAPTSVIATLGDDLDEATAGGSRIGLVADTATDRGLIGGTWYLTAGDEDDDDVVVGRRDVVREVERLLDDGYGGGGAPDLLGVTLDAPTRPSEARTRAIVEAVFARVPEATVVVTTTGPGGDPSAAVAPSSRFASAVEAAIGAPVVAEVATGGVYVDAEVVTAQGLSTQRIVEAMSAVRTDAGTPLLADAFPAFAVSFGRYC